MGEDLELLPMEQPFLFEAWPEQPSLVEKVKRYAHTGASLLKDPERTRDVVEAILNGASPRAVARHFHLGRETVTKAFEHLEQAQKLGPFQSRMVSHWREIFTLTSWRIEESLLDGTMPKQVLPALNGIATDKLLAATHFEPEKAPLKTIDITPAGLAARLRQARALVRGEPAPVVASDSESDGGKAQADVAQGGTAAPVGVATLDATHRGPGAAPGGPEGEPNVAGGHRGADPSGRARDEGGGVPTPATGALDRGFGSEISQG